MTAGHCSLRILDHPSGDVAASWSAHEGWREWPFRRVA